MADERTPSRRMLRSLSVFVAIAGLLTLALGSAMARSSATTRGGAPTSNSPVSVPDWPARAAALESLGVDVDEDLDEAEDTEGVDEDDQGEDEDAQGEDEDDQGEDEADEDDGDQDEADEDDGDDDEDEADDEESEADDD